MEKPKRPEPTTEWSGEAYRPVETEDYMDHLEARLTEAERLLRGLKIRICDGQPEHTSIEMIDTFLDPKEDKDE